MESLRGKWQPTPVFLPGESHGQRSWWATVHGVAKSQTRLKRLSTHTLIWIDYYTDKIVLQLIELCENRL